MAATEAHMRVDAHGSDPSQQEGVRLFVGPTGIPLSRPPLHADSHNVPVTLPTAQQGHAEQGKVYSHRGIGSTFPTATRASSARGGRATSARDARDKSRSRSEEHADQVKVEQRLHTCETWTRQFEHITRRIQLSTTCKE